MDEGILMAIPLFLSIIMMTKTYCLNQGVDSESWHYH